MRILVVEDEVKTADYLRKGLSESGYHVDVALNGLDGQHLAQEFEFDLIILDVMLPGLDGWQLLQIIRRKQQTPVLFLTARDAVEDRVKGLELGADNYLIKPFSYTELLARVRSLCVAGRPVNSTSSRPPTCTWMSCAARSPATASASCSPTRNSHCCICCSVARARCCRGRRSPRMSGT